MLQETSITFYCLHYRKIELVLWNSIMTDFNAEPQYMQEFVPLYTE